MVIPRVSVWKMHQLPWEPPFLWVWSSATHGPGGFSFPHLSTALLLFAVALWIHWRAGTVTILLRRVFCLTGAAWWSWASPKTHLLAGHHFVFPWLLCFSYCLAPCKIPCALLLQVAALRLPHAHCQQSFISHHKAGVQGWPHVSSALFAVSLLFVFFGNCKARESWKGSRVKPSYRLVCLVVWQQAVSCPTCSSSRKVAREEIWVAGSFWWAMMWCEMSLWEEAV